MKKLFILFLIPLGCLSGCSKPSEMVSAPPVQEINSSQERLDLQEFSSASAENIGINLNVTSAENSLLGFTACAKSNNRVFLDMSNLSYPKATGYSAVIWCVNLVDNKTTYVGKFPYDPNKGIFLSKPPYDTFRYELDWYYQKNNSKEYYYISSQKRQVSDIITPVTTPALPISNPVNEPTLPIKVSIPLLTSPLKQPPATPKQPPASNIIRDLSYLTAVNITPETPPSRNITISDLSYLTAR